MNPYRAPLTKEIPFHMCGQEQNAFPPAGCKRRGQTRRRREYIWHVRARVRGGEKIQLCTTGSRKEELSGGAAFERPTGREEKEEEEEEEWEISGQAWRSQTFTEIYNIPRLGSTSTPPFHSIALSLPLCVADWGGHYVHGGSERLTCLLV